MLIKRRGRARLSAAEERLYLCGLRMQDSKKYVLKGPSHKDIADKLGITSGRVTRTIHSLVDKGYAIQGKGKRSTHFVE